MIPFQFSRMMILNLDFTSTCFFKLKSGKLTKMSRGKSINLSLDRWITLIHKEFDITCRLLSSNASLGFGLYISGYIPRVLMSLETRDHLHLAIKVFFAALANEYIFDICNQTLSPDEDARNRPSRPLPAGLLSIDGAYRRWALWWLGAPLVSTALGAPLAALHLVNFEAWTLFCYVWPKPGHWFWKNLYTPVALFFSLRCLNGVIAPHAPSVRMHVALDAAFALWLFVTIHVQDFHDIEGDRRSGRRTLPIVLSPLQLIRLRQITAMLMIAAGLLFVALGVWLCRDRYDVWIGTFAALQLVGGVATGIYFLRTQTANEGENTYKLFHIPTALVIIPYLSLVNNAI